MGRVLACVNDTELTHLRVRILHIRNLERLAPSSQRDPRIPQACIMFALLGIVCLLRQRGTPGGRFPCGLALRSHLVLSISTSSPSRSRYSEMRRLLLPQSHSGLFGESREPRAVPDCLRCGRRTLAFLIPSTWPRLPDGGPSFAPDVRNNLGTSEFPRCGRPLLSQRRALSPAEPGGAFSLASCPRPWAHSFAVMRPRIVFGTILSLPPAWPLLCPAPPLPSFVRALLFDLLAAELVY